MHTLASWANAYRVFPTLAVTGPDIGNAMGKCVKAKTDFNIP